VEAKREILLSDEQWAIEIGRIKKEDEEHEKMARRYFRTFTSKKNHLLNTNKN